MMASAGEHGIGSDELTGLIAAFVAAISFGSYGVPMKGEAATRVDVDPLVFQSYKSFAVLVTSAILIWINNILAGDAQASLDSDSYWTFHKWAFSDFTPWAFVSAILWVPGGTAGVYAIRRAGLAVSVGIWSCIIIILSFVWGVLIFGEKQKSASGAVGSVAILCMGLCGIAYFSSEGKEQQADKRNMMQVDSVAGETTPLVEKEDKHEISLDLETFPHCGTNPHSHQTIDLHLSALPATSKDHTYHVSKYHIGLFMAVVNGVFAATIMVPLHYAPPNTTQGAGYSMSFGIAAVVVVILFWILRFLFLSLENFICHSWWTEASEPRRLIVTLQILTQIVTDSLCKGYQQLPSFHIRVMWKPGLTSGALYSLGNLSGIVSIQKLGNFMGYSLGQSSMIISGLWGIFYYKEIPGAMNVVGFFASSCVVFVGIVLMGSEFNG
mmetsp:Transcript_8460/g.18960  ORF Transcript_8460/g.18960 Transcript_8460/m.18960 type:complete len:439 (+) Transcript_8460:204-1520(+)|eukprot:CAMPEP_0172303382 /NCGR_PEP_ID=MMETSP1058-20130122/4912_1 /TAXON_ID=83371 /ORGANISM="Detonula confervacea, Strain CCMP 353" /LENGTH=438 /DNA_ID=CAMNT_0013014167 /DNA_START=123 /DNA_END=1439 /DNA_ORIENTATION=+